MVHDTVLAEAAIRFVPLGGLGEIGMNCFALEQGDDVLVVDCGISFPEQDLGLDVVHADLSYLVERRRDVRGVFVTHGHEDHIGGLPYLLRSLSVPVWGPPHALGLARRRMLEHGFSSGDMRFEEVHPGDVRRVGPFEVEPIRVAHSIVEATALRIETRAGTVVHTGDFNFDADPPDGEPTDAERLRQVGDAGVALLLSDSTNIDVPEPGIGERAVGASLARVVESASAGVFVSLFASNVQRLISLGQIARDTGRKICLLGRSLRMQHEVATEIGRLHWPSDLLVPLDVARTMPSRSLLVLAGGTQGEARSAMARLAEGIHPDLAIQRGDTVVLSSRIIPGNERSVFRMVGNLIRTGAHVVHRVTDPTVHTSGHATRAEQRRMIDLLRPGCFIPVHGTLHHLTRHAELARQAGIETVEVVENGTPVRLEEGVLTRDEPVRSGRVSIALGGEPMSDETLRERLDLARSGLVTVVVVLDAHGRLAAPATLAARGIAGIDAYPRDVERIERSVSRLARERRSAAVEDLREDVRRHVRRDLDRLLGARPVVDVQIVEVSR
jgi:ribonuclease J